MESQIKERERREKIREREEGGRGIEGEMPIKSKKVIPKSVLCCQQQQNGNKIDPTFQTLDLISYFDIIVIKVTFR